MGRLIVFEGTDGSGKATQTELLCQALEKQGIPFRRLAFPRYSEESSALIRLYLGGAFVCVCTLLILHGQMDMHRAVVGAWQRGEYETVEGQVENFVPMPKEGKGRESFDLGGVHFEYSDNCLITGYHNAKVNGGVIRRDGQRLRIGYVWYEPYGNVIVSIEEIDEP